MEILNDKALLKNNNLEQPLSLTYQSDKLLSTKNLNSKIEGI